MRLLRWILLLVFLWECCSAKTCQDKVSDCNRAIDYCTRDGVGSTVRSNCMLSCGLCTHSSSIGAYRSSPRRKPNNQKPKLHPRPTRPAHREKPVGPNQIKVYPKNEMPIHRSPVVHHPRPQRPPIVHHPRPHRPQPIVHKPRPHRPQSNVHKSRPHPIVQPPKPHPIVQPPNPKPTTKQTKAPIVPQPPKVTTTTTLVQKTTTPIVQQPPKVTTTTTLATSTTTQSSTTTTTKPPEPKNKLLLESLDETVKPCDDFYKFTCGTYIKNHPANEDHWVSEEIQQKLIRQRQINAIMANTTTSSVAIQNMRKYRDLCLNGPSEQLKTSELAAKIVEFGKCPMYEPGWYWSIQGKRKSLTKMFIELEQFASRHFLFDMSIRRHDDGKYMVFISPEPLIMEEPEKYFQPEHAHEVEALRQLLKEVLTLVGQDNNWVMTNMDAHINDIIEYDKKRAKDYANNDYTLHRRARSKKMDKILFTELGGGIFDIIQWQTYIRDNVLISETMKNRILAPGFEILIYNKKLFRELMNNLVGTDFKLVTNYYVARLILDQLPYMDSRFQAALFKYKSKIDGRSGRATRVEECVDSVVELFPLLNDYLYMQSHFDSSEETAFTQDLQAQMKDGVQQLIQKQTWLDAPTLSFAQQKLKDAQVYVGGVAEAKLISFLDPLYSSYITIAGDSFQKTHINLRRERKKQSLVDTSQNAPLFLLRSTELDDIYYRYSENTEYIPASLVNPTFYDRTLLKAYNYGSIGAQYDKYGLKSNTVSPAIQAEFTRRTRLLAAQYSALVEPQSNQKVDGTRTLDENIIDNAAIKASFLAYKEDLKKQGLTAENGHISGYDNYTPEQIFYISYGMSMCSAVTADYQKDLIANGETVPKVFRVNTVLQNDANFAQIFKCPAGTVMNPATRVEVY